MLYDFPALPAGGVFRSVGDLSIRLTPMRIEGEYWVGVQARVRADTYHLYVMMDENNQAEPYHGFNTFTDISHAIDTLQYMNGAY